MQEIHILLVDDNEGDILLTREALEEARIVNRISVAYDGVQALNFLKKDPPFMHEDSPDRSYWTSTCRAWMVRSC